MITAQSPTMVWLRRALLYLMCVAGFLSLAFSAQSLLPPHVYRKDFIQEYLLARALLAGVPPYQPIPMLADRFLGELPSAVFPHPTPHPPFVGLVALPLGLMDYQQAAIVWYAFEIVCIILAVYLLLGWLEAATFSRVMLATLALCAWNPFWEELVFGQLMTLLLVLILLAWQALRSNRLVQSGILLGLAVALKLMGWPIVLFLGVQSRYRRAAIAAVLTSLAANMVAGLAIGWNTTIHYYTEVGGLVSSLYRGYVFNFSLWSVGWRLFEGTSSPIIAGATAAPMIAAPLLARSVSVLLPLGTLVVGTTLAIRARSLDRAFSMMLGVSILVNPVAWIHYLVLSVIPLCVIGRDLARRGFPAAESRVASVCGLLLLVSHRQWHDLAVSTGRRMTNGIEVVMNPWILAVLTLLPALLVLTQVWLLHHLGRREVTHHADGAECQPPPWIGVPS